MLGILLKTVWTVFCANFFTCYYIPSQKQLIPQLVPELKSSQERPNWLSKRTDNEFITSNRIWQAA